MEDAEAELVVELVIMLSEKLVISVTEEGIDELSESATGVVTGVRSESDVVSNADDVDSG